MAEYEIKKSRLNFVYICILLFFSIVIFRLFYIVITNDKNKLKKEYDPRYFGKRGKIFDRNRILVATDLKTKSLYASSILIKDSQLLVSRLSELFPELDYKELLKKINEGKKSKKWILIRRNLTPHEVNKINDLKIAGLIFEDDLIRVYPQREIASHLIGYVDSDRKGLSAIEMQYDEKLSESNSELELAMDVRIQDILHNELIKGLIHYKAKGASGIVFDVNNGEILAISSLPTFDPNLQKEANEDERFNRATNGVYELGSIFKIFTIANAFEKKLIKISDVYDISEPIKYGRFTISDDHRYQDKMTVGEIFAYSSNIGTIQIAKKIGIESQREFLQKLNLLSRLEAKFPGLRTPIFPKNKEWREINLFTIAYGHGIATTPLHIATAVSAIVNGGTLYQPSFLKLKEKPKGKKVFDEEASAKMREMIRMVVTKGTGRHSNIDGYEVGGKTGTANRAESGGYNEKSTIASFVAVFPSSKPQYLVLVVFDRSNYIFNTGGMVSAPVAGNIIKNIAPILGVKPILEN